MFLFGTWFVLLNLAACQSKERIETNLKIIFGSLGVPVEYWYNETSWAKDGGGGEGASSVPGCPKSIEGIPWIYYRNSEEKERCFLAGEKGPCPEGQSLLALQNSTFGKCACDCFVEEIHYGLNKTDIDTRFPYINCKFPGSDHDHAQIFDVKKNVCYEKGSQGPCADGWLVTGASGFVPFCKEKCVQNRTTTQAPPLVDATQSSKYYYILDRDEQCVGYKRRTGSDSLKQPRVQSSIVSVEDGVLVGAGLATNLIPKCAAGTRYSSTLKQCVPTTFFNHVIG